MIQRRSLHLNNGSGSTQLLHSSPSEAPPPNLPGLKPRPLCWGQSFLAIQKPLTLTIRPTALLGLGKVALPRLPSSNVRSPPEGKLRLAAKVSFVEGKQLLIRGRASERRLIFYSV